MIEFCYTVYDINGDRSLARDELLMCFEGCFRARGDMDASEVEEAIQDLVQLAMGKLDVDKDGIITFTDFQAAVENDPLLLQICGVCLPPSGAIKGFQYVFTWDYNNFYSIYDDSKKYAARHAVRKFKSTMRAARSDHRRDFHSESITTEQRTSNP